MHEEKVQQSPSSAGSSLQATGLQLASVHSINAQKLVDGQFSRFFDAALGASSASPTSSEAFLARYRVQTMDGAQHDLRYWSAADVLGSQYTLEQLVAASIQYPTESLIHAIWSAKDFAELQDVLLKMRAVVRFSYDTVGGLIGHVIPSELLVVFLQDVERNLREHKHSDTVMELITRNLGLRLKVEMLRRGISTKPTQDVQISDLPTSNGWFRRWRN